ncbi:autotransporter-associated beta strand repeat-containing protein, partial [Dyella japonica]
MHAQSVAISGDVSPVETPNPSASWSIPGTLTVGNSGVGALDISMGGVVTNNLAAYLGNLVGSVGTASVTGAGSQWNSSRNVSVGYAGNGTLTVADGGVVTSYGAANYVGMIATGAGTMTVTGPGSQWNSSGALSVGQSGNGTLTVTDGGVVTSYGGILGQVGGGVGTANVTGPGSQWNSTATLTVGNLGSGALTIADGGVVSDVGVGVSNTAASIGQQAGGISTVTVTGSGSRWTNSGSLIVGNGGDGALTIADSGQVSAPQVFIASSAGSRGTLNVGAVAGVAATGPGALNATTVSFGAGMGVVNFNHTDMTGTYAFGPAISGAGAVNQIAGYTVLTGDSTYTGGTTISGGTLQLGNGGTSGSIVGDVTDNGALAFDRSDTSSFGGVISGSGVVNQIGAGTTVLTSDNTYTGGTTISAGTLQLGNGGTTGSIASDVADNGALVFNRSDALSYGGAISGAGTIAQIGSGITTLG